PKYPQKGMPGETHLTAVTSSVPLTTDSATQKKLKTSHIVFIVDVKANKHQIKQTLKNLYDIDVAKVSTLIRPNGEKKVYVQLAVDYDA
ncbi:hypothetical protein PANDA_004167, partial [Ailuropoda melanoleuca]